MGEEEERREVNREGGEGEGRGGEEERREVEG